MPYKKIPPEHSEFGGGPGLIDRERRRDRALSSAERRMELMFTDPTDPNSRPESARLPGDAR
jgi:hypothetical protein